MRFIILLFATFMLSSFAYANLVQEPNSSISYSDQGKGTPLILIHAFPTDQRLWVDQTIGLKNNFRVITLDLKGFGNTQETDGKAITMGDYADQVKSLMDQLKIEKAIIGGESMGGYVSLAFVKKYPERAQGLILADTQAIADNEEQKLKREKSAQDIVMNGSEEFLRNFLPKALSSHASADTRSYLSTILHSQSTTAMASALRGMGLREDNSSLLKNLTLPILIITGEKDEVISPEQSTAMHALAKNSVLVVIPGAGHLSNLEEPELWNKAVKSEFGK